MHLMHWWQQRKPPRLVWVLAALNSLLLLLPMLGFSALRLYESALIRQTESELSAQGVVIAAAYRALLLPAAAPPLESDRWQPSLPRLDLARDAVLPPLPEPSPIEHTPEPQAAQVGERLLPLLKESQHHTLAALRVTDVRGVVIAATNSALMNRSLIEHEEVREALAGRFVATMRARENTGPVGLASISRSSGLRVVVAVPIVSGSTVLGAVELLRTPANVWQVLMAKRMALAKAAALLMIALALITALSLRLILQPLRDLTRSARAVAGGQPFAAPRQRGLAEFEDLASSVAQMADTLQSRAGYIRDFAAHVSHEFKTPLAGILATTELLREHEAMSAEQRLRFVQLIEAEAQRLNRLTQKLLELARAETSAAPADASCDVSALLQSLVQRHRERGQQVMLTMPSETLHALIPTEVLDACLSTLLDNVQAHGGDAASVQVQLHVEDAALRLSVQDSGPGISAANAERLFTPFFTTGRGAGHTGLGLCIARALLRSHGGELWLDSARPSRFALRIRLAV